MQLKCASSTKGASLVDVAPINNVLKTTEGNKRLRLKMKKLEKGDEGQCRSATADQQLAYTGIFCCMCTCNGFVCLSLGLSLPVSPEPFFLPVALALAMSVAPLPVLLTLHSLLASLRSCLAFHVALVV